MTELNKFHVPACELACKYLFITESSAIESM
ncbi:hypothetical protein SAMN05421760_11211 [Neptunomonas antarctica]|uniref:Uncharacterized protein n=1 Tax=Neptunomonas antarctica TaxID=619304 RepID=A0A1N7P125_9GAMM|nr:hypothetical protein SAMN05421760_11211 [Neptunomonas antarctica]